MHHYLVTDVRQGVPAVVPSSFHVHTLQMALSKVLLMFGSKPPFSFFGSSVCTTRQRQGAKQALRSLRWNAYAFLMPRANLSSARPRVLKKGLQRQRLKN